MKLVPKLSLAFMLGTTLILSANGYFRVRREVAIFETERRNDDALIGHTLGAAVAAVWRSDGPQRALDLLDQVRLRQSSRGMRARWIWLDGDDATDPSTLAAARQQLLDLPPDGTLSAVRTDADPGDGTRVTDRRYTYVRVPVPDARHAAIEVSQPFDAAQAFVRRVVVDTVITALVLDGVCAALAMILGVWLVGTPVRALIDKARRVGAGDFGRPLDLGRSDELGDMATEMNVMCDRLVEVSERAVAETRARLGVLDQLRHADRLMTVGKLASGIAHELGTPLNVVEARATMLARGDVAPAETVDFARVIMQATERMTRIIRQLLDFARPSPPHKERADLGDVARRTIDLLKPLADKRDVELSARTPAGAPPMADVDSAQIEQAVANLVMNAIHASQPGGVVEIAVDHTRAHKPPEHGGGEADCVSVAVADRGGGIPEEHIAHVFEPFFTTKEVGEGTGLGLSVTYGIVREHGGWISVESEPGRGTTFTVHLPVVGEVSS